MPLVTLKIYILFNFRSEIMQPLLGKHFINLHYVQFKYVIHSNPKNYRLSYLNRNGVFEMNKAAVNENIP